jgi:hypothetical protein
MRSRAQAVLVALVAIHGVSGKVEMRAYASPPPVSITVPWTITASHADRKTAALLDDCLRSAQKRIETFFGHPFEKSFSVEILPDRSRLDEYCKERWQLPRTERWMVAMGVADKLLILTPRVWKTEAVEHDPKDPTHFRELVAHELVHVYHGQHNPTADFAGMDDLGWFVEGLAVYVSGQLEHGHKDDARKAISSGKAPVELAKAWSGPYRYGVSGSMVRFLDKRYGRGMVWQLLSETKPEGALHRLNLSEKEFLQAWRDSIANNPP